MFISRFAITHMSTSRCMRFAVILTEVFRYVVSLTRAIDVSAVSALRESALVVVVRWT